jgi:dolichyl-phosphate-mannose--protein O-mannosyl transferase
MSSMQAYASRTGWIMLAAVVMFSVGVFRIISGISYLANSHKINDYTAGFFGDNMWAWGLWDLLIAVIAIWAAFSLLKGGEFGRVIAYLWAILVIINSFLTIGIAPWFGAAMLTLALLVIYGLASTPVTPLRAPEP